MTNNISVMTNKSLERSIHYFEKINDVIKGVGIVGGGIAASLADWVFGSITFAVLFSNYGFGNSIYALLIGFCISMGSWGVQLILWQILMTGKYSKMVGVVRVVFFAIVMMKLADDITDLMAVYWMLKDNPFQGHIGPGIYTVFISVVFFLVWILVGFSELFVSISISLLKPNQQQQQTKKPFPWENRQEVNSVLDKLPKKKGF